MKRCLICGKEFGDDARRRYCPECSKAVRHSIRKTTVEIGGVMKCEVCGKEIIRTVATKRYCHECHAYIRKHHLRPKKA